MGSIKYVKQFYFLIYYFCILLGILDNKKRNFAAYKNYLSKIHINFECSMLGKT